ncbi:unnamed protein product [Psylliodes chrysocephalus]|uniref:DUF4371 domain-containing protein n=1 Tax=Psylliodes chrysocephalus TaxID=3402493 RepID=A0A9P0CLH9_9CUCU|nr:unnamed protein product [Psylliodes chrysocephala]
MVRSPAQTNYHNIVIGSIGLKYKHKLRKIMDIRKCLNMKTSSKREDKSDNESPLKKKKATNEEQPKFQGEPTVEEDALMASCSFSTNREEQKEWSNDLGSYIGLQLANNFIKTFSGKKPTVTDLLDNQERQIIEENRKKLVPIISTILLCGKRDLALRGKEEDGNFEELLKFRVESGDKLLENHLATCSKTAKYTSHQIQNQLIELCGKVIRQHIIDEANESVGFSVLADETADIAGKEQLSIGIRYLDKSNIINEHFLGFTELKAMNAHAISSAILSVLRDLKLNLNKLVGLGFDGCSTMAGKENGVQQLIRNEYPNATFFHCSSHKLNLVINDLNSRESKKACNGFQLAVVVRDQVVSKI